MKVLFVGEHPYGLTGNSLMMLSILENFSKNEINIFCPTNVPTIQINSNLSKKKLSIHKSDSDGDKDVWGEKRLLQVISSLSPSLVVFVGIDFWRYIKVFQNINELRKKQKFKWIGILPYDLPNLRKDWIDGLRFFDHVFVYSKFGYNLLNGNLSNVSFFSPPMHGINEFKYFGEKNRKDVRQKIFPTIPDDGILFGFVGQNQIRKDPQTLLLAFRQLFDLRKNTYLYLHTDVDNGVYNLRQYIEDLDFPDGRLFIKEPGSALPFEMMSKLYSSFDYLINVSYQEGLSWTVIQSLLCGTPVLISQTTAHLDYANLPGVRYIMTDQVRFLPIITGGGQSWVQTVGCSDQQILSAILHATDNMSKLNADRNKISSEAHRFYKPTDFNFIVHEILNSPIRKDAILFAQHSSAGDVLMTTRCFKGLKERHPDKKLVYMTQPKYFSVLKNNPYIDELIEWDETKQNGFEICYNPHGERILKGEFNSLDVKLSDMYHLLLKVKPDDFFIYPEKIDIDLPKEFVIIHSSGQEKFYRTYKHMDLVVQRIPYPTIQIGDMNDLFCPSVSLDLRGKLSFNQTAWLMKKSRAAIVIDSFPSHLAGAMGTPVIVLYGPAPARVTGPVGDQNKIINLEPNKLFDCERLTNCWGRFRGCKSPCIDKIHPDQVYESFCELIRRTS